MNTRIASMLLLAVVAGSGARAQTELPAQWVDTQIKAARQDQRKLGQGIPVAAKAAPAAPAATPGPGQQGPADRDQPSSRSVAKAAKAGSTAQE